MKPASLTAAQKAHLVRLWTFGCLSPETAASEFGTSFQAAPRVLAALVAAGLAGRNAAGFWLTPKGRRRAALLCSQIGRERQRKYERAARR